jgi:hypothetical protein
MYGVKGVEMFPKIWKNILIIYVVGSRTKLFDSIHFILIEFLFNYVVFKRKILNISRIIPLIY